MSLAEPAVRAEEASVQRTSGRPSLVAPGLDAWLLGGLGVVAWLLLAQPFGAFGGTGVPVASGVLLWGMLAASGTHFGISYHLAYGQGRSEVRRRWPALIGVPVALAGCAAAIALAAAMGHAAAANGGIRLLLVAVFTLTGWHYLKQVYGVARLVASIHGLSISPSSGKVLRYGLYPLWFLNASVVWTQGYRPTSYGFAGGFEVLPPMTDTLLTAAAVGSMLVVGGCFVRLGMGWRRVPPASMWAPYLAGYLWFVWTPGHLSTFLVLGALHGIQYLVCAHRAELAWGAERGEPRPALWWACAFGGALAAGMLLSYWMPRWLSDATASSGIGPVAAVLLFACFNLHHYAVDSAIWRSGGGHIRRIVSSRRA